MNSNNWETSDGSMDLDNKLVNKQDQTVQNENKSIASMTWLHMQIGLVGGGKVREWAVWPNTRDPRSGRPLRWSIVVGRRSIAVELYGAVRPGKAAKLSSDWTAATRSVSYLTELWLSVNYQQSACSTVDQFAWDDHFFHLNLIALPKKMAVQKYSHLLVVVVASFIGESSIIFSIVN